MEPLRVIGVWSYEDDPDLSLLADPEWDTGEAEELSDYLEFGTLIGAAASLSAKCRICGFSLTDDLVFTDGKYQWHQIFYHYVRAHKTRPPESVVSDMLDRQHALQLQESDISWWRATVDHHAT